MHDEEQRSEEGGPENTAQPTPKHDERQPSYERLPEIVGDVEDGRAATPDRPIERVGSRDGGSPIDDSAWRLDGVVAGVPEVREEPPRPRREGMYVSITGD